MNVHLFQTDYPDCVRTWRKVSSTQTRHVSGAMVMNIQTNNIREYRNKDGESRDQGS